MRTNGWQAGADPSNAGWQRGWAASHQRLARMEAVQRNPQEVAQHFEKCHSILAGMESAGMYLDQQTTAFLTQLKQASAGNYTSLVAAARNTATAGPPKPPPTIHIPDPMAPRCREISLTQRRESAARLFEKCLWEAASGELQKLMDAGEPLQENAPKLITCLLNAHETPLASDVIRIRDLLAKLDQAGHAALATPFRQQLEDKLPKPK